MTADKLLDHCESLGIRLFVRGRDLGIDAPRSGPNAWLAAELSAHKAALLALLGSRERGGTRESHRRAVEQYADVVTHGLTCPHCHSRDIALIPDAPPPHWASLRCLTCEKFVGWAPMPPELAGEWVCPFQPYRGMTIAAIAGTDRGRSYLRWAALNMRQPRVREMVGYFLDRASRMPSDGAASQPAASGRRDEPG